MFHQWCGAILQVSQLKGFCFSRVVLHCSFSHFVFTFRPARLFLDTAHSTMPNSKYQDPVDGSDGETLHQGDNSTGDTLHSHSRQSAGRDSEMVPSGASYRSSASRAMLPPASRVATSKDRKAAFVRRDWTVSPISPHHLREAY